MKSTVIEVRTGKAASKLGKALQEFFLRKERKGIRGWTVHGVGAYRQPRKKSGKPDKVLFWAFNLVKGSPQREDEIQPILQELKDEGLITDFYLLSGP